MAISINGMELSKPGLVILLCATITTLSSGTNCECGQKQVGEEEVRSRERVEKPSNEWSHTDEHRFHELICLLLVSNFPHPDVIGSYAPQLADRLHLTSTQISLVAAAGNWGVSGEAGCAKGQSLSSLLERVEHVGSSPTG